MKRLLLLFIFLETPVFAVPVVPNFQQGSLTSHTETTSKVTEVISVVEYQSGWQLSLTGNNISVDGDSLLPSAELTTTLFPLTAYVEPIRSPIVVAPPTVKEVLVDNL